MHTYPMFIFFNDPATPEIYTLSLHDALPISARAEWGQTPLLSFTDPDSSSTGRSMVYSLYSIAAGKPPDRKSTRLNSSHANISYAVFCLKKKTYAKADISQTIIT